MNLASLIPILITDPHIPAMAAPFTASELGGKTQASSAYRAAIAAESPLFMPSINFALAASIADLAAAISKLAFSLVSVDSEVLLSVLASLQATINVMATTVISW